MNPLFLLFNKLYSIEEKVAFQTAGQIRTLYSRAVIFIGTKIIKSTEVLILSLVFQLTEKLIMDPLFFVNQWSVLNWKKKSFCTKLSQPWC